MTTAYESRPGGAMGGKMKRLLAASAAALIAGTALATSSAWASIPPDSTGVRPGKNVSVFHNIDMVAAFGYPVGQELKVEVFRNGVKIGSAAGPAVSTEDGGALEVNHGVDGAVQPGDCWTAITPDVIPGDKIVVTGDGGTDEILVDDIEITEGATLVAETADKTDVVVKGHARFADGTPIPVNQLNGGELRHDGPRFRANPNTVERTPGTEDGWTATYKAPYRWFQIEDGGLLVEEQTQAVLNGTHSMGYGHTEPLPAETQLVEGIGGGGPAPGCEGSPQHRNAVTTADDKAVNINSGDLVVGGSALADATAVTGTVTDAAGKAVAFDATASLAAAIPGQQKSWKATVLRADLDTLADGPLTISAQYTVTGGTIGGRDLAIRKDTVAPNPPTATPGAGTYARTQSVSLEARKAAEIRFTQNGTAPNLKSQLYVGPIRVSASQTIKAVAVDGAGNKSTIASFRYRIN